MSDKLHIAALTTGRQDYGIMRSTLRLLEDENGVQLSVLAGGMHLRPRYGYTIEQVRADGFAGLREVAFVSDPPEPVGDTSRALEAIGRILGEDRPDILLLVGDRTETLAAGLAATVSLVPIAHIHGGEETEGAIDNACRHALTKLSHLHLVSHERHAERIIRMGEDPASVIVVGAPGLDNRYRADLISREELERSLGQVLTDPVIIVTMHPATLGADPHLEVSAVARAMEAVPATYIVTAPNADRSGEVIHEFWRHWVKNRERTVLVDALGELRYWSLMRCASAVLGNSSSGIIEAPALGIPVVNVGERQRGRERYGVILDVPPNPAAIELALREALADGRAPAGENGGYLPGLAGPRIVRALLDWEIARPPRKRFFGGSPRV